MRVVVARVAAVPNICGILLTLVGLRQETFDRRVWDGTMDEEADSEEDEINELVIYND